MPTDYLTDDDKQILEGAGFKPNNGQYGWTPYGDEDGVYTIVALARKYGTDPCPEVISIYSHSGRVYHTPFSDVKDFSNKSISPRPPKEMVFSPGQFEISLHGAGLFLTKDRLHLLVDSDIGMKVQEFRANIDRGEYDLVFRRRE